MPTSRTRPVCLRPSCALPSASLSALCRRGKDSPRTAMQAFRSTPGVLAPVWVLVSQSISAYPTPSAPLAGTSRFRCLATYTPCLRCAFPPRRPTSGSVLSLLILSRHVVLSDYGKFSGCLHPVPSPLTLAFAPLERSRHFHPSRPQTFPRVQPSLWLHGRSRRRSLCERCAWV